VTAYLHPLDHTPLALGTDGNLYDNRGQLAFKENAGSYDFAVGADEEKAFHDDLYTLGGWCAGTESLDALDYDALWNQEPGCIHYLHSLGDMHGKRVLLLGNGTSVKEFLFIRLGARLTFTDLSFQGVLYTRARFRASEMGTHTPGACDFHAVNAYCLPFENDLFDLICADAVVHHLDDLKTFFAGIYRCLKPGGLCRFLDTGYASLWQKAKSGVLRRLREFSYTKHPISP
jgi:SAM-dependent methyltransferase